MKKTGKKPAARQPHARASKALRGLLVAIDSVQPDPQNARKRTPENLAAIRASLETFGFQRPILAYRFAAKEKPTVISGNGALQAATELGWDRVPVLLFDGTRDQARAYAIADNRTAELSEWDEAILGAQTSVLDEFEDLWRALKIEELLPDEAPAIAEDEAPPLPTKAITKPGDVWTMGDHRLVCGDSGITGAVRVLMGGGMAECMWTDPPYGVDYTGKTKHALKIAGDGAVGLEELLRKALAAANSVLTPGSPYYIAHPAGPGSFTFEAAVREAGWKIHQTLIWLKDSMVLGYADYHYRHEPILYGWTIGKGRSGRGRHAGSRWFGDHSQTSVLEYPRPKRSEQHPTMKPVALIDRCLRNSTKAGEAVYEPFAGSGSTLIACEQLGRKCYAMEIDPRYCDVIVHRWEKLTGRKAERA